MRVASLVPGGRLTTARRGELVGAVLSRDLTVAGERLAKGRRLTAADLDRIAVLPDVADPISVLILDGDDLHEDDAARRLATAVAGPGLTIHGPVQSRIDLRAAAGGVLHIRSDALERINRIDPLEVFTAFDGSVVSAGDLVASVKVAPHVVSGATVAAGERIAGTGRGPVIRLAPFVARRVGVVVREALHPLARERFEASVRDKVESLGSEVVSIDYADDDHAVDAAMERLVRRRGTARIDLILTAGGGSTDPRDPFFVAIDRLGGRVLRHGVPAHPGSMLWLARCRGTAILGLPTCGAYSKATAADLVLPRLLTGEPPSPRLVSGIGHGGLLTRDQRFRFPPYARTLDAPEG